jgi:predicted metal-dependent phosphoesterase TrpH
MIDLHTHSTFSDGTSTPTELVNLAEHTGLTAFALTDHDTVDGIDEGLEAAGDGDVLFIPGVELSAQIDRGVLHILGLFVDHTHTNLTALLNDTVLFRERRNEKIIERFRQLDISVSLDEVQAEAGIGTVGRPHFAQVLTKKGYTRSVRDAFLRYLSKNGAAYFPKVRIPPERAISVIGDAGGVSVLAHPDQTHLGGRELATLIERLKKMGLKAMETRYSGYTRSQSRKYARLAERFCLKESGGSDFHGAVKPGLRMGFGRGDLCVPDAFLPPLRQVAGSRDTS